MYFVWNEILKEAVMLLYASVAWFEQRILNSEITFCYYMNSRLLEWSPTQANVQEYYMSCSQITYYRTTNQLQYYLLFLQKLFSVF